MNTRTFNIEARRASGERITGSGDVIRVEEDTAKLAHTVGLCKAMQRAGWTAHVYGSAHVTEMETGREWKISVEQTKEGAKPDETTIGPTATPAEISR